MRIFSYTIYFLVCFLNASHVLADGIDSLLSKPKEAVLVVGGAGYIGTQTCKLLEREGYFPVVYDNLITGHENAVEWGTLEIGDIADRKRLSDVIDKYAPKAVIHFAALKAVGESVKDPAKYYINNVCGSITLLDVLREKKLNKIIFSSTAAVYGAPDISHPIKENEGDEPINPYGWSKWMVEKILNDFHHAYGFEYVVFRYFNASGADPERACGERGKNPQNLIPIVLQVSMQERKELEIFGNDYSTPDGTAIRDYIHVYDLADAHVKAVRYLLENNKSITLNLGTGKGSSVVEVVEMAKSVTRSPIPTKQVSRRPGDPASLTANADLAKAVLNWEPHYSDLKSIIQTEWAWHKKLQASVTIDK